MQGSAAVIGAGGEEIRQHIVFVGGADERSHRQSHLLCQVPGQNVSKVAGGDGEVHLLPPGNLSPLQKVAVGLEIIGNLGGKPSQIHGVGGGKAAVISGGKDMLHPGLGIVKVALHPEHEDVAPLLGHHLGLLHLRDPAFRVEHADFHPRNIPEALQSCLAGVSRGGGEDENVFFHPFLGLSGGEKLGKHAKGHILEGAGGAVEQLQHRKRPGFHRGGHLRGGEFAGVGLFHQAFHGGNSGKDG